MSTSAVVAWAHRPAAFCPRTVMKAKPAVERPPSPRAVTLTSPASNVSMLLEAVTTRTGTTSHAPGSVPMHTSYATMLDWSSTKPSHSTVMGAHDGRVLRTTARVRRYSPDDGLSCSIPCSKVQLLGSTAEEAPVAAAPVVTESHVNLSVCGTMDTTPDWGAVSSTVNGAEIACPDTCPSASNARTRALYARPCCKDSSCNVTSVWLPTSSQCSGQAVATGSDPNSSSKQSATCRDCTPAPAPSVTENCTLRDSIDGIATVWAASAVNTSPPTVLVALVAILDTRGPAVSTVIPSEVAEAASPAWSNAVTEAYTVAPLGKPKPTALPSVARPTEVRGRTSQLPCTCPRHHRYSAMGPDRSSKPRQAATRLSPCVVHCTSCKAVGVSGTDRSTLGAKSITCPADGGVTSTKHPSEKLVALRPALFTPVTVT